MKLVSFRLIYRRGGDRVYRFVPPGPVSGLTRFQRRYVEMFVMRCLTETDIVGLTWEHDGLLAAVRQPA